MYTLHLTQLSVLDVLFREKENELKQSIADLQLQNVKDDNRFKATVDRIKHQILLEPVTIGEPKITGQAPFSRAVPANYENLLGGAMEMYKVSVDFPFSGSSEVLQYRANGQPLTIDNIYQAGGRAITVEVELRQLDKAEALGQAKKLMATTLQLVEQNNPYVQRWSAQTVPDIEERAKQKRKELLDFFS